MYSNRSVISQERALQRRRDFTNERYAKEIQLINEDFTASVQALKDSISDQVLTAVDDEKSRIAIAVRNIPSSLLTLQRIADLQIDQSEFESLVSEFGHKNYWADKYLSMIQQRNDVVGNYELEPPASTRLAILDNAIEELNSLFEKWTGAPGEKSYAALNCLSDKKINQFEDEYGRYCGKMDSRERAQRAFSRILSISDTIEKGFTIRQTLSNLKADPDARNLLMYLIAKKANFPEISIRYAGQANYDSIMAYRRGEKSKPVMSEDTEKEVSLSSEEQQTASILSEMHASQQ